MKRGAILGAVVAGLVTAAHAEPPAPAGLSPDQIRAAYARASAGWQPLPPLVRSAFVLAEDKRFWTRSPLLSTVTRSVGQIVTQGHGTLGATALVGQTLDRDQIADWFVHDVFLGQACFGVKDAAQAYFGKDVAALSLAETALLAALPVDPTAIKRQPDRVVIRRNRIIDELRENGVISPSDADAAKSAPLDLREPLGMCLH